MQIIDKKIFETRKEIEKEEKKERIEKKKTEAQLKRDILACGNDVEKIHNLLKETGNDYLIGCSSIKSGKYGDYVDFCNFYGNKNIIINF